MRKKITVADILEEAAYLVETEFELLGCLAIMSAARRLRSGRAKKIQALKLFAAFFEPKPETLVWFGPTYLRANQNRRVFALCLTAQLARRGVQA